MENITIIVALITALAGIFAPSISALISQRGAYKVKSAELFFHCKVDAYTNFIHIATAFPLTPTDDDLTSLHNATINVLLLSSDKTQEVIAKYEELLVGLNSLDETDDLCAYNQSLGIAQGAAIKAMRDELKTYQR